MAVLLDPRKQILRLEFYVLAFLRPHFPMFQNFRFLVKNRKIELFLIFLKTRFSCFRDDFSLFGKIEKIESFVFSTKNRKFSNITKFLQKRPTHVTPTHVISRFENSSNVQGQESLFWVRQVLMPLFFQRSKKPLKNPTSKMLSVCEQVPSNLALETSSWPNLAKRRVPG